MGVNSLPKTVTQQRHSCDLNQGPSAPESSTLTTQLLSKYVLLVNLWNDKSDSHPYCKQHGDVHAEAVVMSSDPR